MPLMESLAMINSSSISLWDVLPKDVTQSINLLITLGKVTGVVLIIYISIMIVRGILAIRDSLRMKILVNSVVEIDKKLDRLIKNKKHK